MSRPKVAVFATTYFPGSHADCFATPLIKGYEWEGRHIDSRIEVVSFYLEQIADDDMGVALTDEFGIPRYPTAAEAMACGGSGVQVDGVIIIGEHGGYELNEFGQKLYPRRRLFDSAVSCMIGAGKFVPIFNDKHFAWSFADAQAMYDTARRLGIPMVAGSTIPLAWRMPIGTEWPLGEPMSEIVAVGFGPSDCYGFHNLEGLQVHAERRHGGETGVAAVQGLSGESARTAVADGRVNRDLLEKALRAIDLNQSETAQATASIKDVFFIEYADGLKATVVNCDEVVRSWGFAAVGPTHEMTCRILLQGHPYSHSLFLVRQYETLILDRAEPLPVERTLLTTGILEVALQTSKLGAKRETPELCISYQPVANLRDTGIHLPLPD